MNIVNFIKACKIALAGVIKQVSDWNKIYLGCIIFPTDDDLIRFIFYNDPTGAPGSYGISYTVSENGIKSLTHASYQKLGLFDTDSIDKEDIAQKYLAVKERIDEVSRFIVILEILLDKFRAAFQDDWKSLDVSNVNFCVDKDILEVTVNDMKVRTNGVITMW